MKPTYKRKLNQLHKLKNFPMQKRNVKESDKDEINNDMVEKKIPFMDEEEVDSEDDGDIVNPAEGFEDPFDDEYEEEDIVPDDQPPMQGEGMHADDEDINSTDVNNDKIEFLHVVERMRAMNLEESKEGEIPSSKPKGQKKKEKKKVKFEEKPQVWLESNKRLGEGEFLDFDNRAYDMIHRCQTEWPCLSCDVVEPIFSRDALASRQWTPMNTYPYTVYLVAGTQADTPNKNAVYIMKFTELHKTKHDDESDHQDSEDGDIDNDEEPKLMIKSHPQKHPINRLKSLNGCPIVALWNENGEVIIVDITRDLQYLEGVDEDTYKTEKNKKSESKTLKTFKHSAEGFAIDWSSKSLGRLATGSTDGKLFLYNVQDESFSDWARDDHPYVAHKASVEDIQFSPIEDYAFASCSVDGSVKVYDMRVGDKRNAQINIKAHDCDVNVISWNIPKPVLIASGADDGCFKIWDVRYPNKFITEILWHNEPITSIAFQPNDESVVAVASADNRVSIWDFSVEPDDEEETDDTDVNLPHQLMFLHQGQEDIKEIRYHPRFYEMLISTSNDGIHVFKPNFSEDSVKEDDDEDDMIKFEQ
eukprot:TRINITY_DN7107_c0_g1_i1.p1 TRINITY_DN7107_c0_g1~~TRINITY_DN7107_c0_g1_i1.p1  ORF type:complete len:587 (+),score=125.17 TRINITY_DN7107_c0_g1_i1:304-2064(+)